MVSAQVFQFLLFAALAIAVSICDPFAKECAVTKIS